MGRLPQDLEEKRLRLLGAVQRGAFESYVRRGHVPEVYKHIAAVVVEAKNLGDSVVLADLTPPSRPPTRPTSFYTWRTAGDDKVRGSHAALNGRVFAWSEPPEHGHPGHEPNCRCWPEPYYGYPSVPDSALQMISERRVNTDPEVSWASIETLIRPDGSLAASSIVLNDGTVIDSTFLGPAVDQVVTLPSGDIVRLRTRYGIQSIYLGEDDVPLLQSRWTHAGPRVVRARRRLAFLLDDQGGHLIDDPLGSDSDLDPLDPNPATPFILDNIAAGIGIVAFGLIALYELQKAAPAVVGLGDNDASYIAFRAWVNDTTPDGEIVPLPVLAGSLTEEQVRQSCKRLLDVQAWVDEGAEVLAPLRETMSEQEYGRLLHRYVQQKIERAKEIDPIGYADIETEFSVDAVGEQTRYGGKGSSRYDVYELVPPDNPQYICDYDVKTGGARLGGQQLARMIVRPSTKYPGATVVAIEIVPSNDQH